MIYMYYPIRQRINRQDVCIKTHRRGNSLVPVEKWRILMLKLIVGLKGSGKTKTLIEMVNAAPNNTNGAVVCLEQGDKLKFDITHQVRLIDTKEYAISDGQALYGFICGIVASNHDITDIFVDSALKICRDSVEEFALAVKEIAAFVNANNINCVITSSIAPAALPAELQQFLQ